MTYLSAVLADAPRNFWRCADAGGGLLADIGSLPRAMSVNASTPQLGYKGPNSDGGSIWIDANSIAQFADAQTLALPLTLEAWVWQHYRRAATQVIATVEGAANATAVELQMNINGLPQGFGPTTNSSGAVALAQQTWHHLVVVVTAAATTLYVDAIAQVAGGANAATPANPTMGIGGHLTPGGSNASMNIAEVALYTVALAPARITAHFVAADQTTQFPVYQGFGAFNLSTGVVTFNSDLAESILASVRKTY